MLLDALAEQLAALIPEGTEVLAGLEMGGIAVVTALGRHTGLPCAFVRKKAKQYGTARLAEGAEVAGRRVLVVEDVVTSGGQVVISTTSCASWRPRRPRAVRDRPAGGRRRRPWPPTASRCARCSPARTSTRPECGPRRGGR